MVGASAITAINNWRNAPVNEWTALLMLLTLAVLIGGLLVWLGMYLWDNWIGYRLFEWRERRARRRR